MSNVLNMIERNIIVTLLSSESVVLHVFFYQEKTDPVEFVIKTGFEGVKMSARGVIVITQPPLQMDAFVGREATLVFYFRTLGLSFTARLTKSASGLELAIPLEIRRLPENETETKNQMSVRLFFSISGQSDLGIPCIAEKDFPLFRFDTWRGIRADNAGAAGTCLHKLQGADVWQLPPEITRELQKSGKLLYLPGGRLPEKKPFAFDCCVLSRDWDGPDYAPLAHKLRELPYSLYMPLGGAVQEKNGLAAAFGNGPVEQPKIEELIYLTVAANYLTAREDSSASLPLVPEGTEKSLSLLFVSEKILILGGAGRSFPLEKNQEYALQMTCSGSQLIRQIYTACFVSEVYTAPESEKQCALCIFTNLKAEDKRFLFEKLYGIMFQ
ncbi:MAG: hypothetical protein LBS97_07355 [Treponema sp.]|jgi:hypothetical protein|nr:hypothetical protein [Treponema sp.]